MDTLAGTASIEASVLFDNSVSSGSGIENQSATHLFRTMSAHVGGSFACLRMDVVKLQRVYGGCFGAKKR